jgi:hypothetical protein
MIGKNLPQKTMLPLHVGSQEDLHAVNQRTTGFQALPADHLFRASRASRPGHDGQFTFSSWEVSYALSLQNL